MTTYYEHVFGFVSDIYDLLEKSYNHYSKIEFIQLLHHAKNQHQELQQKNEQLKKENEHLKREILKINQNIISSLERDLTHMRKTINIINTPKHIFQRTVEQLDV